MSYIKLLLGGKERGLKFNQLALEIFTKHFDYETTASQKYATVYAGLRGNSYVKREEVDYTFEEVVEMCDAADVNELNTACNAFTETQFFTDWYEKFQGLLRSTEPTDKKKVVKKTKKSSGLKSTSSIGAV